jgi:hypothetical protein
MDLVVNNKIIPLRFGVAKNGTSESFMAFELTKLENKKHLPLNFLKILNHRKYFQKLELFLKKLTNESKHNNLQIENRRLGSQLGSIWEDSIREVLELEIEKLHPGFISKMYEDRNFRYYPDALPKTDHKVGGVFLPLQWKIDYNFLEQNLLSTINKSIWEKSHKWNTLKKAFLEVKELYIEMIERSSRFKFTPELVKQEWIKRIRNEDILIPGSDPFNPSASCATTLDNAYRYNKGGVTYCAGYISAMPPKRILAHELSHALAEQHSQYLFENNLEIKKRLKNIILNLSHNNESATCPKGWQNFKADFSNLIKDFDYYIPLRPEFLSCLQTRDILAIPSKEYINQRALARVREGISREATSNFFLQISKPTTFTNDGLEWKNSTYLNPTSFTNWDEKNYMLKHDFTMDFFFASEYACSNSSLPPSQRLENAINVTQDMAIRLSEKLIVLGGKFSSDRDMVSRDYAEDTDERFADAMASELSAYHYAKIESLNDRRKLFFAEHASFCNPISIREMYVDEAQVQNKFSLESHAAGKQRKIDVLTLPMRDVLQCKLDFVPKNCEP